MRSERTDLLTDEDIAGADGTYEVNESGDADYGFIILNVHTPLTEDLYGKKVWDDDDDSAGIRPDSVTIVATGTDGSRHTTVASEGSDWQFLFDDLSDVDENGNDITYTISEKRVDGYENPVVTYDEASGTYVVTNKLTPEKDELVVRKEWDDDDNRDGMRPESVTVRVTDAAGTEHVATLDDASEWEHTFEGLATEDAAGNAIDYKDKVVEDAVVGYESSVDVDERTHIITVTNKRVSETVEVRGTKVWEDDDDETDARPTSVTLRLRAKNRIVKTIDVSPTDAKTNDRWTFTFGKVPKYEDGEVIEYKVEEVVPDGYGCTVTGSVDDGFTVTNKLNSVDIEVRKIWDDEDDEDELRPDSLEVYLEDAGERVEGFTATLNDDNYWAYLFEDVPLYREDGTPYAWSVDEADVEDYEKQVDGSVQDGIFYITNTHKPELTDIEVTKRWVDEGNLYGTRPESITVDLNATYMIDGTPVTFLVDTETMDADGGWKCTFEDLFTRVKGEQVTYSVEEEDVAGYVASVNGDAEGGFTITNTLGREETLTISGKKTWEDADDAQKTRPASIKVYLLRDNEVIDTKTVTAADEWSWSFEGLPKRAGSHEYAYAIAEDAVEGYNGEVDGFDIHNLLDDDQSPVDITGQKVWEDGGDVEARPDEIVVYLLADGEVVDSKTVTGPDWKWEFSDLPAEEEDGSEIVYSVLESYVQGYDVTYASDGDTHTITNTRITRNIGVNKFWVDNLNVRGLRPEYVTVNLMADGVKVADARLDEALDWAWTFMDMPVYAKDGHEIAYTIDELDVPGYTTHIHGFEVTNVLEYEPPVPEDTTTVTVTKHWDDGGAPYAVRPETITVYLLADGGPIDEVTLPAEESATHTFKDLPKEIAGAAVTYSVDEVEPEGWQATVSGDAGVFTITNTPEPPDTPGTLVPTPRTTKVEGSKTWDDNENARGLRPNEILIHLLADGMVKDSRTVTGPAWFWSFDNLPTTRADGKKIDYRIVEKAVEGYDATYTGFDVKNTQETHYEDETVEVWGKKVWVDGDDADGLRPNELAIYAIADEDEIMGMDTTSAAKNWEFKISGLPKYEGADEISYTVAEDEVEGYRATVSGSAKDGFTITNRRVTEPELETVTVSGAKSWIDNDNALNNRPTHITINLLANGEAIFRRRVTAESDWKWVFDRLPKIVDGKEVTYSISEAKVEGYDTFVDGYDVTNILDEDDPGNTRTIRGHKTWVDANDAEGKRPESIRVRLLANGVTVDAVTVGAADNWAWTFDDLPTTVAGDPIEYTVVEDNVKGYTATVDGFDITNRSDTLPEPVRYDPMVRKVVSGSKPASDATFAFELKPKAETNPMPDGKVGGSKRCTVTGSGTAEFGAIAFDAPGVYEYTVQEVPANIAGYTFDTSVYTLRFEVTYEAGKLSLTRTVTKDGQAVSGDVTFTNVYKPTTPDDPDVPYVPYVPYTPYTPWDPYTPYVHYPPSTPNTPSNNVTTPPSSGIATQTPVTQYQQTPTAQVSPVAQTPPTTTVVTTVAPAGSAAPQATPGTADPSLGIGWLAATGVASLALAFARRRR